MSYSNLILNTEDNNSNITFTSQALPNRAVAIKYNGTGIHTFTGPVPLVDISNSINNGSNDLPESVVTNIRIQGKIVRHSEPADNANLIPPTPGISGILGAISGLKELFTNCPYGNLEIICESPSLILYVASGCLVKDINFSQTDDNWTKTADYDISLEHIKPVGTGYNNEYAVTNKVDRWSIEQIDDSFYTDINQNISQKSEYSNPQLGATFDNRIPPQDIGGRQTDTPVLRIVNLPQFRITHNVSARGLPPTTGYISAGCPTNIDIINKMCLDNAKAWVTKQLARSVSTDPNVQSSGMMPFMQHPGTTDTASSTFFFNHIRSVNVDFNTYEVSESWIAMPTGIPYTETYSLESSVDENFNKTVRVVGNIVGLHPFSPTLISNGVDIDPSGKIDLSPSFSGVSPAVTSNFTRLDDTTQSSKPGIKSNKYTNALSGWLFDIKPQLYRRACLVINTPDRTLQYTSPAFAPTRPPENPIYSKENLLSTIPSNVTEGHDPRKGTISYSAEYKNNFKILSGVISENIDISFDVPHDEVSTITVPGRVLGPILSRTGRSASRKTINISIVVMPPTSIVGTFLNNDTCPLYTGGQLYKTIQDIIYANKPFVGSSLVPSRNLNGIVYTQSDNEQWSAAQGRYSRSVQWIYQACDVTKDYMEN